VSELPTGTVTFLFTDLEGSTRLWEEHPRAMRAALARHDAILRDAVLAHDGHIVKTTGDGVHAAFTTADRAIEAALAAQLALHAEPWPETGPLRVRMGLHTGAAEQRDGDYFGPALNRGARLMAVANGGQVVVSEITEGLVRDELPPSVALLDLGEHRLRDVTGRDRVFQLSHPELPDHFAPLRSIDEPLGNLPVQPTSFVGRDADIADVTDAITAARVVTLTGVGGVGKTRLALEVAARAAVQFRDGAWLCELAPVTDTDAMIDAVATGLDAPQRIGQTVHRSVLDFLANKAAARARQLRAPRRRGERSRQGHRNGRTGCARDRHEPRGARDPR
jgi:class 3 adenylate cyclase